MEKKGLVVSISGKGGVGKTTVAALLLKALLEENGREILIVDADPATNLPDAIAVPVKKTVGTVSNDLKKQIQSDELPPGVPKSDILEGWIMDILVETPKFDILAMGRTEGEGCYCFVNDLLTKILDTLSKNYDLTIMDMEPGLEHLSRRTDRDVDVMIVVTDVSKMGFETAQRIRDLAKEVHIRIGRLYLVVNRVPSEMMSIVKDQSEKAGLELAGIIPVDTDVLNRSINGESLLEVPEDSPALKAVREITKRVGLIAAS